MMTSAFIFGCHQKTLHAVLPLHFVYLGGRVALDQRTNVPHLKAVPVLQVDANRAKVQLVIEHHQHATRLEQGREEVNIDRKSTRLNSSHQLISYAVFCLKK